jgi:hypothetical protein
LGLFPDAAEEAEVAEVGRKTNGFDDLWFGQGIPFAKESHPGEGGDG